MSHEDVKLICDAINNAFGALAVVAVMWILFRGHGR